MRDSALKHSSHTPKRLSLAGRRRAHARQRFETEMNRCENRDCNDVGEELMRDSALKRGRGFVLIAAEKGRRRAHARQRFETIASMPLAQA